MLNSSWMGRRYSLELYEKDGMIELSMADVAGGGIQQVHADERKTYICNQYQGFNWYNAPMIVNYAAKVKK